MNVLFTFISIPIHIFERRQERFCILLKSNFLSTYSVVPIRLNENIKHAIIVNSKLNCSPCSITIILKENLLASYSCCTPGIKMWKLFLVSESKIGNHENERL